MTVALANSVVTTTNGNPATASIGLLVSLIGLLDTSMEVHKQVLNDAKLDLALA